MPFDERNFWLHTKNNPYSRVRGNGFRFWGHPHRQGKVTCIVLHTTQNRPNTPARNVANWQAHAAPEPSSYHTMVDSKTILNTLPEHSTAFHCRKFNSISLGLSFTTMADLWGEDPDFDLELIRRGAHKAREWSQRFKIPARLLTRAEALRGTPGYIYHSVADPGRRRDPGRKFPLNDFFRLVNNPEPDEQEDEMTDGDRAMLREIHEMLSQVVVGKIGGRDNIGNDIRRVRVDNRAIGRALGIPIVAEGGEGEEGHAIIS